LFKSNEKGKHDWTFQVQDLGSEYMAQPVLLAEMQDTNTTINKNSTPTKTSHGLSEHVAQPLEFITESSELNTKTCFDYNQRIGGEPSSFPSPRDFCAFAIPSSSAR
jgi:hypothetical protein